MTKHYVILYVVTLFIMLAMDMLWLKGIAADFYKNRIGELLEFRLTPAAVFYLIYAAGILVFVSATGTQWKSVLLYGAFFGFIAYITYDLSNMATIRNWPLSLTLVDIGWGTFNTAFSTTAGWLIARYFAA